LAVTKTAKKKVLFHWQCVKTAKEMPSFHGSPKKSAMELYFLGCLSKVPRKYYISWRFNYGCQENFWPPRQTQFGVEGVLWTSNRYQRGS